jgi:deazaflavin-dependent oxidoreductase (nitroreductase family)
VPPFRLSRAARVALRLPTHLYDWHVGWILGERFLRLTHVGRRSGRTFQTVLEVVGTDPATGELIVMAGFGPSADWFQNLKSRPAVEIAIGRRRFSPEHRILDESEAGHVLAVYEHRHRLVAPAVRHVLGRLVGWRYDGSENARRRVVHELPMVAFRPSRAV